jgi:protein-tyrosine phosphatase
MSCASRKLPLEGAWNVRDLGGYRTATAGITRRNTYLRGDSLANLSDADVRLLTSLGVQTVIDLREPIEASAQPSRLLGVRSVKVHQVPLFAELRPLGGKFPTELGVLYVLCLEQGSGALRRTFELLAAAEGAVLFHCAVGKDRTGIVAALLLELVGVPRPAILEDYMASEANLKSMVGTWIAQYEEDPATGYHPDLLHCLPQNMERLLDFLAGQYGGAEAYLRQAGVSEAALQTIRSRLAPGEAGDEARRAAARETPRSKA